MNKKFFIILGIILAIVLLISAIVGAYLLGKRQSEQDNNHEASDTSSSSNASSASKPETAIEVNSLQYTTYVSDDALVSFQYPDTWIKSEIPDVSLLVPESIIQKYDPEIPFIATAPIQGEATQVTVSKMSVSSLKLPQAILEEMMQDNSIEGVEASIINSTQINDNIVFESEYQTGNTVMKAKEIMILFDPTGDNTRLGYIVTFQTYEKDWNKYKQVADYIINNVNNIASD
jgi:hypothetical protein